MRNPYFEHKAVEVRSIELLNTAASRAISAAIEATGRSRGYSNTCAKEDESIGKIYIVLTTPLVNTTVCINQNGTAARPC